MGPACGSGAYAQKIKWGVLEQADLQKKTQHQQIISKTARSGINPALGSGRQSELRSFNKLQNSSRISAMSNTDHFYKNFYATPNFQDSSLPQQSINDSNQVHLMNIERRKSRLAYEIYRQSRLQNFSQDNFISKVQTKNNQNMFEINLDIINNPNFNSEVITNLLNKYQNQQRTILEEIRYSVDEEIFYVKLKKNKQLKDLCLDFENNFKNFFEEQENLATDESSFANAFYKRQIFGQRKGTQQPVKQEGLSIQNQEVSRQQRVGNVSHQVSLGEVSQNFIYDDSTPVGDHLMSSRINQDSGGSDALIKEKAKAYQNLQNLTFSQKMLFFSQPQNLQITNNSFYNKVNGLDEYIGKRDWKVKVRIIKNTEVILKSLADSFENRTQHYVLVYTKNQWKFGESDKVIQTYISALNNKNYQIFQAIMQYQGEQLIVKQIMNGTEESVVSQDEYDNLRIYDQGHQQNPIVSMFSGIQTPDSDIFHANKNLESKPAKEQSGIIFQKLQMSFNIQQNERDQLKLLNKQDSSDQNRLELQREDLSNLLSAQSNQNNNPENESIQVQVQLGSLSKNIVQIKNKKGIQKNLRSKIETPFPKHTLSVKHGDFSQHAYQGYVKKRQASGEARLNSKKDSSGVLPESSNILLSEQSQVSKNCQPFYLKKTIYKSNVIQNSKFQTNIESQGRATSLGQQISSKSRLRTVNNSEQKTDFQKTPNKQGSLSQVSQQILENKYKQLSNQGKPPGFKKVTQPLKKKASLSSRQHVLFKDKQATFDLEMPVEGRVEEEQDTVKLKQFLQKGHSPEKLTYNQYLNSDRCLINEENKDFGYLQNASNRSQSGLLQQRTLEDLVRLRQQLDRELQTQPQLKEETTQENILQQQNILDDVIVVQNKIVRQQFMKNELKNANKALEEVQKYQLELVGAQQSFNKNSPSAMLAQNSAQKSFLSQNTLGKDTLTNARAKGKTPMTNRPLSLQQQFERDYHFPPVSYRLREIDLPDRALLSIIQFIGIKKSVSQLMKLNRNWYCRINFFFEEWSSPIEIKLYERYNDLFKFSKTKIVFGPTDFGNQKGVRIDRIMTIEVREDSASILNQVGKTIKLECAFKYWPEDGNLSSSQNMKSQKSLNQFKDEIKPVVYRPQGRQQNELQQQNLVYSNVYRFDLVKSRLQSRQTWIHLSDRLPGYAQNEIQIAPGDRIQLGFCFYNLNGFVDVESVEWAKATFPQIHSNMKDFLDYNRELQIIKMNPQALRGRKILCDIDRVCDVEDSVYDWIKFDSKLLKSQQQIETQSSLNQMQNTLIPISISPNLFEYFEVLEIHYNETDQHYVKKLLKAKKASYDKRPGSTTNFNLVLQFDEKRRFSLSILPQGHQIVNEVRKRGVVADRNKSEEELQIRVGDIVCLYETKHIPAELQKTTNLGD